MAAARVVPKYNYAVEEFKDEEYPMAKGKIYLDHGGTTLCAKSLIESFATNLVSNLYGNPDCNASPSTLSRGRVEIVRRRVLHFFKADPQHFDLIFVPNTTAAIKLVMESFRDLASVNSTSEAGGQFWYGYHRDAHTSLVGVRETTKQHHCFENDQEVESWLNGAMDARFGEGRLGLFAYPGQSNMTGRRLPLSWPGRLRKGPKGDHTYSLLDAAALAPTSPLDFSDVDGAPDFTALSFYKIFGFPDLGALIVRKSSGHILQWRKYFGSGTVDMVLCVRESWHARKDLSVDTHYSLHDQLEDGTLPFHSIIAVGTALNVHKRLFGTMLDVSAHSCFLGKKLYDGLSTLKHMNGQQVCRIYKEAGATYGDSTTQGPTIAFNVQRADGSLIPHSEVQRLADQRHIYLRSGGLDNPGGIATYLDLAPWEMKRAFSAGLRSGHPAEIVSGKPTGAVRVSLGAMTTMADVEIFLRFMRGRFAAVAKPPDLEDIAKLALRSNNAIAGSNALSTYSPFPAILSEKYVDDATIMYVSDTGEKRVTAVTSVPSSSSSYSASSYSVSTFEDDPKAKPLQPVRVERPDLRSAKSLASMFSKFKKSRRYTCTSIELD